jgi:hypothetical protein
MKPTEMTSAKGTTLTPEDGKLFTVTITFSDTLESEFQGVVKATKTPEGGYWLLQQDDTWNDISPGFLYAEFREVVKE